MNGLRFADRFGKIGVAAGGGLNFVNIDDANGMLQMMSYIMGGRDRFVDSYAYLPHALGMACDLNIDFPKIHMVCGTADALYQDNVALDKFLSEHGIVHTFTEYPDEGHTWQFLIKALPELFEKLAQV